MSDEKAKHAAINYIRLQQEKALRILHPLAYQLHTTPITGELVEKITRQLIASDQISDEDREDWRELHEEALKSVPETTLTGIGNIFYDSMLQTAAEQVRRTAITLGYSLPEEITVATVPDGVVNARAFQIPTTGLAVMLHEGLFTTIYLMAKAVSRFFYVESVGTGWRIGTTVEEWYQEFETNREAHRRYLEALIATIALGEPQMAPLHHIAGSRLQLVETLAFPAEIFVISHEFAHLILGHYERAQSGVSQGRSDVEKSSTIYEQELAADRIALQLTLAYYSEIGWQPAQVVLGIDLLFNLFEVFEEIKRTNGIDLGGYPSIDVRHSSILSQLRLDFSSPRQSHLAMYKLWEHNKARFWAWYQQIEEGQPPWSCPAALE